MTRKSLMELHLVVKNFSLYLKNLVSVFLRLQQFFYNQTLDPDHFSMTKIRFLQLMYGSDSSKMDSWECKTCSIFTYRSSQRRCSVKKGVFKKFANFTGNCKFHRTCVESLSSKVAGLQTCKFIKKKLRQRYFPVKFVKICERLLLFFGIIAKFRFLIQY